MSCATNDTTRPPHEEWSRVAPRLRPTHTGSPRASDALPLRTATDRAGPAAPFTWNELRHAERSRVAPRLRPPTDRAGPAAPATVRLLIVARPFVFHGGVERATAGLVTALAAHGYDVHVLSPPGQRPIAGVAHHVLPLPPLPSAVRVLALAALARVVVAGGGWDVVQSHERTLRQDTYRAGEGCHRAYLESIGAARGPRAAGAGPSRPPGAPAAPAGGGGRITGRGRRPDLERCTAGAAVAGLRSGCGPFGNVHLEARASGLPVGASAAAGGAEAIVDGGGGAVGDPRAAGAGAAALARPRGKNPAEPPEAAPPAPGRLPLTGPGPREAPP